MVTQGFRDRTREQQTFPQLPEHRLSIARNEEPHPRAVARIPRRPFAGYFIDHAANHHPEVDAEDYYNIQGIIDTADDVKLDASNPNRNPSLIFIKQVGKSGFVVVSFDEGENGKIVLHKTFFTKTKKGRFDKLPSVKLSPGGGNSPISHAAGAAPAGRLSALGDSQSVGNFVRAVNQEASAVTDPETGEPLVVYHGSDWNPLAEAPGYAVFDKGRLGENSGNYGHAGAGHYFSTIRLEAERYGEHVGGYFLNIRKPFDGSDRSALERYEDILSLGEKGSIADLDEIVRSIARDGSAPVKEFIRILREHEYSDDGYSAAWDALLGTLSREDALALAPELDEIASDIDEAKKGQTLSDERADHFRKRYGESSIKEGRDYIPSLAYALNTGAYIDQTTEFSDALARDGFDGILYGSEVIAFDSAQVKSATHNTGAFNGDERDIRFSFAGERGAAALDAAEEVTHRMDNLAVAREMEAAGKDAKTEKMATGWERGKDGKWRYEIDDNYNTFHAGGDAVARRDWPGYAEDVDRIRALLNKKENAMLFDTAPLTEAEARELAELQEKRRADIEHWRRRMEKGNARLMDALDAPELFRAYPQLENVTVDFADLPRGGATGSITPDGKNITLARWLDSHNKETVLHHEIQHAIQLIEGFAPGVNPVSAYSGETAPHAFKELERLRKEVGTPRTREQYAQEAGWDAADVGTQEFEDAYRDYVKTVREAARGKASDRAMQETAAQRVSPHRWGDRSPQRAIPSRHDGRAAPRDAG